MHRRCCNRCAGAEGGSATSSSTREFAQALLGKVVPSAAGTQDHARHKREQLEWLAAISTEHERRLRRLVQEESDARARHERLEWLSTISTVHEADWDPAKHPRGAFPQNRGWFSPTGGSGGTRSAPTHTVPGTRPEPVRQDHMPPRMLELADQWWKTNSQLLQSRHDLERLPKRIANLRAQVQRGGRYAYLYKKHLARAERELQAAKAQIPQLEAQLHEFERQYRESGYDEIEYTTWTPAETLAGGRGIERVGHAVNTRGFPAGLKPTGIEVDVALGAASVGRLTKAALKTAVTRSPGRVPLRTRVSEVHTKLDPIAQSQRTTAVLETADGSRIMASGGRDLTPAQRALLGPGEIAATSPRAHAEMTALEHAAQSGFRPAEMVASRPFCPKSVEAIEAAGGRITSPTTAEFPR